MYWSRDLVPFATDFSGRVVYKRLGAFYRWLPGCYCGQGIRRFLSSNLGKKLCTKVLAHFVAEFSGSILKSTGDLAHLIIEFRNKVWYIRDGALVQETLCLRCNLRVWVIFACNVRIKQDSFLYISWLLTWKYRVFVSIFQNDCTINIFI